MGIGSRSATNTGSFVLEAVGEDLWCSNGARRQGRYLAETSAALGKQQDAAVVADLS